MRAKNSHWLIDYFKSGWAFLIPYLVAYLLYALLKWPVNPTHGTERGAANWVPCLLHVFWALHAIHVGLSTMALRVWWSTNNLESHGTSPLKTQLSALWPLAPWLCLALVFWIPGLYLEWPSDLWEHLRRTTEWAIYDTIGYHSAGYKSFYFLSYSVVAGFPSKWLLPCTTLYYVACCLLLAWHYYRLAHAVGLSRPWALAFVTTNLLTFGNTCFSFYRYYGLATTVISQLGAVALTRIVLEACQSAESARASQGVYESSNIRHSCIRDRFMHLRAWWNPSLSVVTLVALISSNHIQGLGIAMLGVGAVIIWRLLQWRPSVAWWLLAGTLVLSAFTILIWPKNATVDLLFREKGWLSAWYGFNLARWPSPAADRALLCLGAFGLLNLGASVLLVRRGHVAGWLTLFPIVTLLTPMAALPFATMLAESDASRIVTFHRMLFAIPSGLALVSWLSLYCIEAAGHNRIRTWGFVGLIAALSGFVATSPTSPCNNRLWNLISVVPADLQLAGPVSRLLEPVGFPAHKTRITPVTPAALMNLAVTINPKAFQFRDRPIWDAPIDSLIEAVGILEVSHPTIRGNAPLIVADIGSSSASTWKTIGGNAHRVEKIDDNFIRGTVLENHRGKSTDVFSLVPVAIDPSLAYRIEATVRQIDGPTAGCLLAVAWLDADGLLLESNVAAPAGAANPNGWVNGTYSYFGPLEKPTPRNWTLYRKSLGPGKFAHIPAEARYVRLGALLNPHSTQDVVIQVTNIHISKAPSGAITDDGAFLLIPEPIVLLPAYSTCWSSASQAAQFSGHWSPQLVSSISSGGRELQLKAEQLGVPVITATPTGDYWPQSDRASTPSVVTLHQELPNN